MPVGIPGIMLSFFDLLVTPLIRGGSSPSSTFQNAFVFFGTFSTRFSAFEVQNRGRRPPALRNSWAAELDASPARPLCGPRAAAPPRDAPEAPRLARYPAVGGAAASDASSGLESRGSFSRPCAPWPGPDAADGPAWIVPGRISNPDFDRPHRPSVGLRRIPERRSWARDLRGRQLGRCPDASRRRRPRLLGRRPGWSRPSTA